MNGRSKRTESDAIAQLPDVIRPQTTAQSVQSLFTTTARSPASSVQLRDVIRPQTVAQSAQVRDLKRKLDESNEEEEETDYLYEITALMTLKNVAELLSDASTSGERLKVLASETFACGGESVCVN